MESLEDIKYEFLMLKLKPYTIVFNTETDIGLVIILIRKLNTLNRDFRSAIGMYVFQTVSNDILEELPHL